MSKTGPIGKTSLIGKTGPGRVAEQNQLCKTGPFSKTRPVSKTGPISKTGLIGKTGPARVAEQKNF